MKRYILIFLILILFAVTSTYFLVSCAPKPEEGEYIRIHIRANSNSAEDQSVKLAVRDAVVQYLTPIACRAKSKEEMWKLMEKYKKEIVEVADATLMSCGYDYRSNLALRAESFPERSYGALTLKEGVYDALILELGSGEGENWWCVAFPPLCFIAAQETGEQEIRYRSWIAEKLGK